MAPTSTDPKDLKLVLNPARRKALAILAGSIITHMRSQIVHSFDPILSNSLGTYPLTAHQSRSPTTSPGLGSDDHQKQLEARLESNLSSPQIRELKNAALKYFDDWKDHVLSSLGKIINAPEDPRFDQRRKEWLAARNPPPPPYSPMPTESKTPAMVSDIEAKELQEARDISALQHMYPPIPTRLNTISRADRVCVISCMVLLLLGLGHYSAHSRVFLCHLTSAFGVPLRVLSDEETEIAKTLLLASKTLSADTETQKRRDQNATSRRWKVGLAAVGGAALVGITGGFAAPIVAGAIGGIMGGVGLGGLASFLGIFAMNGALVGTLFGAYGAKMTGTMVDNYAKEVEDFKFLPIKKRWGEFASNEDEVEERRLRVTIGISKSCLVSRAKIS
jgi:hypothetical protein